MTLFIICLDEMVIIGDDAEEIEKLQGYLAFEFEMKNLEGLK